MKRRKNGILENLSFGKVSIYKYIKVWYNIIIKINMCKKYKDKPKYIQAMLNKLGIEIWDLPHTHTFYPSSFSRGEEDKMFKEVFANGYELVCLDTWKSRYIFKLKNR